VQIYVGDMHGLNTLEYQPAKVAAMEANWETGPNVPLLLFALPDQEARENRFEIAVPNGASWILTHHADGVVPGLNDFVAEDGTVLHPRVAPVFWSFRVMVGTGVAMLGISWLTLALLWWRGVERLPKLLLFGLVAMTFSGWLATLAGWYTTEIGRQPWLVQGVLTTKQAVADVPAPMVLSTLIGYLAVYGVLLVAYIGVIFYLAKRANDGKSIDPGVPTRPAGQTIPAE